MTTINFSSKEVFIRKIVIKENEDFYFFEGFYNVKGRKSYIIIEKLKFNKDNYKELCSKQLKDILKFSEAINNYEIFPSDINNKLSEKGKIIPINDKSIEEINSIFGFIKFNMGYYIILACNSDIVGKIGINIIYRVDKLKYFPLFEVDENFMKSPEYIKEKKYINLVQGFSYDKQLYFSYSYNLTNTLQRNFVESFKKQTDNDFSNNAYRDEKGKISLEKSTNYFFCWNYYHMEEFFELVIEKNKMHESWINYFIYGYFGQNFCNIRGFWLQISVIGRRNRHFAGRRYLKRGITTDGNVANDVETEQILEEVSGWIGKPKISSFIQIRGSIPIYWFQTQNSFYHKPEIKVNLSDIRFKAMKRHFSSLIERYGVPCIVCNLTKKIEEGKKQETLLNEFYYDGINYINDDIKDFEKIIYYHYDLKSERVKKDFYKQFYEISCPLIAKTNLFSFIPNLRNEYSISLQDGVIRTNCIDCLDRTNVFQQILGIAVLIIQLRLIGINESFPENENETIYGLLTKIYRKMGHELSNQYTGTFALKQSITDNRNIFDKVIDIGYEIIIACKRSMINYFNDQTMQNSMNLFLGKYKINSGEPLIWEMPGDDALHKIRDLPNLPENWYKINYDKYCKFNMFKDIEGKNRENNIYIRKPFDERNLNKDNNKHNYKMSKTTKLICKSLYKDKTMEKINNSNYSNSNINEYIIDYSEFIQNRPIEEKEEKEENEFNDDSIYRFITGKKCLENFSYFFDENKNKNNNNNNNINNDNNKTNDNNNDNNNKNNNKNDNNKNDNNKNDNNNINNNDNTNDNDNNDNDNDNINNDNNNNFNNENNKKINEKEQNNNQNFNMKKKIFLNKNNLKLKEKTNYFGKSSEDNYRYASPNPNYNLFYQRKEIEKLNLKTFQMNEEDLKSINRFIEPISKNIEDEDLFKIDTFEAKEILNENENLNFEEFYNYEEKKKKEEEIVIEINDTIYFDPINNKLSRCSIKNKNNDEIKKNYKNEEENKIIQENEENNVNKDKDEENDKNSINLDNEDNETKEKNKKIEIKRVKFDVLKIEEDYFTEKEK